jgi:hypothetical protein
VCTARDVHVFFVLAHPTQKQVSMVAESYNMQERSISHNNTEAFTRTSHTCSGGDKLVSKATVFGNSCPERDEEVGGVKGPP